jgi:hypothetical protein
MSSHAVQRSQVIKIITENNEKLTMIYVPPSIMAIMKRLVGFNED